MKKAKPIDLIAGMQDRIDAANANKIDADLLPDILVRHRAGNEDATEQLETGLEYLVWARFLMLKKQSDRVLTSIFLYFSSAIGRLQNNDEPNAVQYIKNELKHSYAHYMREESEDILPPKNMKKKCDKIKRTSTRAKPERWDADLEDRENTERWDADGEKTPDILEDSTIHVPTTLYRTAPIPDDALPHTPPKTKIVDYNPPSKFLENLEIFDDQDLREKIDITKAWTKLQKEICQLVCSNYSLRDIADSLHLSKFRVENELKLLRKTG